MCPSAVYFYSLIRLPPPSQDFESLFLTGLIEFFGGPGGGVDMSPQKLHLEKRGYDDLSRGFSCLFLNSTLNQNQPKEHSHVRITFSFPLWVLTLWCLFHGVIATHAHSVLSMLQLPYRHLTLCVPPQRVLCFLCFTLFCHFDF